MMLPMERLDQLALGLFLFYFIVAIVVACILRKSFSGTVKVVNFQNNGPIRTEITGGKNVHCNIYCI